MSERGYFYDSNNLSDLYVLIEGIYGGGWDGFTLLLSRRDLWMPYI